MPSKSTKKRPSRLKAVIGRAKRKAMKEAAVVTAAVVAPVVAYGAAYGANQLYKIRSKRISDQCVKFAGYLRKALEVFAEVEHTVGYRHAKITVKRNGEYCRGLMAVEDESAEHKFNVVLSGMFLPCDASRPKPLFNESSKNYKELVGKLQPHKNKFTQLKTMLVNSEEEDDWTVYLQKMLAGNPPKKSCGWAWKYYSEVKDIITLGSFDDIKLDGGGNQSLMDVNLDIDTAKVYKGTWSNGNVLLWKDNNGNVYYLRDKDENKLRWVITVKTTGDGPELHDFGDWTQAKGFPFVSAEHSRWAVEHLKGVLETPGTTGTRLFHDRKA